MSLTLANDIKNSIVLTGYIVIGKYKILHSVVEVNKDGKIEILDWTKNIIMNKEDYINLFDFKVLTQIKIENILNDFEILNKFLPNFSLKTYLVFRDELMKDLEKNKFMLEELDQKDRKGR